jgi:hypothetical protein
MSGKVCREVRREIDQSELGQSLSANAETHVAACPGCAEFRGQRSRLRELVGALTPVTAPLDFDMRLRARLAREREAPRQPFIFRFVMSTPGIVLAAVLVLVVGTIVFISQRKPQSQSLASGRGGDHVVTPAPEPAPAVKDENPDAAGITMPANADHQGKPKQSPLLVRNPPRLTMPVNAAPQVNDLSAKGAQIVRATDRSGEVSLGAPLKPMVVTMYDEHGATRKIQLPPISFGSQRLTDNRVPVSLTNSKDW